MSVSYTHLDVYKRQLYAIVGALKEDEELGWMANALLENPQALNLIFNGSTVDILQQEVSVQ